MTHVRQPIAALIIGLVLSAAGCSSDTPAGPNVGGTGSAGGGAVEPLTRDAVAAACEEIASAWSEKSGGFFEPAPGQFDGSCGITDGDQVLLISRIGQLTRGEFDEKVAEGRTEIAVPEPFTYGWDSPPDIYISLLDDPDAEQAVDGVTCQTQGTTGVDVLADYCSTAIEIASQT